MEAKLDCGDNSLRVRRAEDRDANEGHREGGVMDTDTAGNPVRRPSAYCSLCCGPTDTAGHCRNGCEQGVAVVAASSLDTAEATINAKLREENDRLREERDVARAEVARLREMPPPVCTGSGTVPVDAQVSYSTLPTEGRCGICGQMAPLANSTNFVLATHPFRAAKEE